MKLDAAQLEIIYLTLVNLGTAWYGLVFVIPNYRNFSLIGKAEALTSNLFFGTVCLALALSFKRLINKHKNHD